MFGLPYLAHPVTSNAFNPSPHNPRTLHLCDLQLNQLPHLLIQLTHQEPIGLRQVVTQLLNLLLQEGNGATNLNLLSVVHMPAELTTTGH